MLGRIWMRSDASASLIATSGACCGPPCSTRHENYTFDSAAKLYALKISQLIQLRDFLPTENMRCNSLRCSKWQKVTKLNQVCNHLPYNNASKYLRTKVPKEFDLFRPKFRPPHGDVKFRPPHRRKFRPPRRRTQSRFSGAAAAAAASATAAAADPADAAATAAAEKNFVFRF